MFMLCYITFTFHNMLWYVITCYVYVMLYNMFCLCGFITCYVYVMLYNMLCLCYVI